MIDLERIERKERKKGADPPDHPRAEGSRRTRASINVSYHRRGVESYMVLARLLQEFDPPQGQSLNVVKWCQMREARPHIYSQT